MPPDNKTKTYTLDGKTYTVPADTTMDELDQYIRSQSAPAPPDTLGQAKKVLLGIPRESNLGRVLTGPPLLSMQPGLPAAAQVPENARAMSIGSMIGAPVGGLMTGGISAAPAIARTLAGSLGGSAVGGYGGRKIGGLFGPRGAAIGEGIGTIGGGFVGGYTGYKTVPPAPEPEVFPLSKSSGPYRGPASVPEPTPPLGSPENPGYSSKLPTRLPPNLRGDPFNPEPPVQRLGTTKGVSVYPEPREPLPGDRPGAAWSQGREATLPASAQRGAPGAVDVLRNIGKPIVLTPRSGVGYPTPGEFEAVREPLLGRSSLFEGPQAPSPGGQPEGVYEPGEREGYLESVIRGAPGENPVLKSLLRNLQKTRKPPLF